MSDYYIRSPNRYVCYTLDEMRKLNENLNHFSLYRYKKIQGSLIEEAQTLVNRMEAALEDWNDLEDMIAQLRKVKKEMRVKKKELKTLKDATKDKGKK